MTTPTDTAALYDPDTGELLFLRCNPTTHRWSADITTLDMWCAGLLRIYQPSDTHLVTMPDDRTWPLLSLDNVRDDPSLEPLPIRPWIPDGAAIPLEDTDAVFAYERSHGTSDPTLDVNAIWRPVLDNMVPPFAGRPVAPLTTQQQPAPQPLPLPAFVVALLRRDAVSHAATCPITDEPLRDDPTHTAVAPCGHLFQRAALCEWLRGHATCPTCRAPVVNSSLQ